MLRFQPNGKAREIDEMLPRSTPSRMLRYALFLGGACMLLVVLAAYIDRFVSLRAQQARFTAKQEQTRAAQGTERPVAISVAVGNLASSRSAAPSKTISRSSEPSLPPLGLLKIPKVHLQVPILEGTDELTLNRGVGWIPGTSLPGKEGNSGIAGHRDSFFRQLKKIEVGDEIEVLTVEAKYVYSVAGMRIVSPSEVDVLRPREKSSITLVTCYPFSFIGSAPSRYIVEASLKQ